MNRRFSREILHYTLHCDGVLHHVEDEIDIKLKISAEEE